MNLTEQTALWQALPEEQKSWPVLSHSQLQSYNKCQYAWYIAYKLGYGLDEKSEALEIGTLVHEGLEAYYRAKKAEEIPGPVFAEDYLPGLTNGWIQKHGDHAMKYAAHATWLLHRYLLNCEYWDDDHLVLDVEKHFLIPMVTPRGRNLLLQGYIDLVTLDRQDRVWAWDHKTGKFWTLVELTMDPQLPLYMVALSEIYDNLAGQITNQLNNYDYKNPEKILNDQLFRRDAIPRSENELINIARDVLVKADKWLDALEASDVPERTQGRHTCKYCNFAEACGYSLKGFDIEVVLDTPTYRRRDTEYMNRGIPEDLEIVWEPGINNV